MRKAPTFLQIATKWRSQEPLPPRGWTSGDRGVSRSVLPRRTSSTERLGCCWRTASGIGSYASQSIVGYDAMGPLLAEAFAHAMNVREDQRLCAASRAHDRVEDDCFKEGEAQRVGREGDAPPRMRCD